jgi:type I restriction-modification system DNA methylase subunit/predicted DNA-binding transcriptional regulator AlpA
MRKARPTDRPEGCRAHFDELLPIAPPMLLDYPMFVKPDVQPMTPEEPGVLTASAIARLAGVGRAAVSNWRRRYPEFPKPVAGGPGSPMFSRVEVEDWLTATGKADQLATAGRTETGTQLLTGLSAPTSDPREIYKWKEIFEVQERSITDLSSGELLAKVMASLLPRTVATAARSPDADEAELPVVIDPACHQATLLMAVADRFGNRVRVAGQEIQESAADLAALNLRSSEHDVQYEIQVGDSLLEDRLAQYLGAAAAVVCEPPLDQPHWPSIELTTDPRWEFGTPAARDSELAWVQHCYAHLRRRGVAIVATSPRTGIQASGLDIRAALVRSGALRDVIALPSGLSTRPNTDINLWVLQRPFASPDHEPVRMVDLSRLGNAADVPNEYAAWQRLFRDGEPTIVRSVPRLELLDGDVNLLPSRHVAANAQATAVDMARVTDRLRLVYSQVAHALPTYATPPAASTRHSYVTLGELERSGALTIRSRDSTPLRGDVILRTLGRDPVVAEGTDNDDAGVAQLIEIDQSRLDAHFVAIFLRADANALPATNTLGALSREDLRRCRIPRMRLAEQRRYGDTFRRLLELEEFLTKLARISAKMVEQNIQGLINGTLTPTETSEP